MKTTTCAACGIDFCLPDDFMDKLRQTGREFHCPNGHSLVFRPSENKKLKARIAELEEELRLSREVTGYLSGVIDGLRGEVAIYQRKFAGYKGQYMRLRNSLSSRMN